MNEDIDRITVRVVIYGRVHGVWYRGWTVDGALARGLSGWVRNRSDGTVEALLAGPAVAVRDMIEACRSGPSMAKVIRIDEFADEGDADPVAADSGFQQRPSV